jgi:hypothetical protein
MTVVLRAIALAIIVLAAIDPARAVRREEPGAVDVRLGRGGVAGAADVHASLVRDTKDRAPGLEPASVVLVDPSAADLEALPTAVPVSIVLAGPREGWMDIVRLEQPAAVLPGQAAVIPAELHLIGLAGASVQLTLEQNGAVLGQVVRSIDTADARISVDLSYTPPAAGIQRVRVVAVVASAAQEGPRAHADVAVVATARPLRVLVFEPRPSWGLTFVRQALERDPALEVAVLGRTSRGIVTRTAHAPARLLPAALARFDVVLTGAPEGLSEPEIQALEGFARDRGGAVVLQPDSRPSGPYARRLPAAAFDEVLLERPASLAIEGGELRASEMAVARRWSPGVSPLGTRAAGDEVQPVITSWTLGEGRFVFSGALDAWRYRADDGLAFDRFWQSMVANLAAAAPRPLELSVEPAVAAPGDPLRITARLRGAGRAAPPISAALLHEDGIRTFVRLWPTAGEGVFEGRLHAPTQGRHVVQVAAGPWTADAPVLVADGIRQPRGVDRTAMERVATGTGGVIVDHDDLAPLHSHLRQQQMTMEAVARPLRSAWWFVAAIGALCGEWALRRRRGLR